MSTTAPPDTVVLIHGLWMTARCWEHWVDRYTARGLTVVAESWPGMDRDIEDIRANTSAIDHLGITEITDHYAAIISGLSSPPVIMGHSFGGLFTQLLLDRGLGAAGVAIDPAPIKGVLALPFSTLKASFPVLKNPANRHRSVMLTPGEFHYGFTNTLSAEESRVVYDRYAIPGPGRVLFQGAFANVNPHAAAKVDLHNRARPPLLVIGGWRRPHHPAQGQRQHGEVAAQDGRGHGLQGVPGPIALHARPGRLGVGGRLRHRVGAPTSRARRTILSRSRSRVDADRAGCAQEVLRWRR
jgi:pimeloyl-ACP methyl ester carboxylesterase